MRTAEPDAARRRCDGPAGARDLPRGVPDRSALLRPQRRHVRDLGLLRRRPAPSATRTPSGSTTRASRRSPAMLDRYDTGYWSRYDLFPHAVTNVASPAYHRLHIEQLKAMALLTDRPEFASAASVFEDYLEPTPEPGRAPSPARRYSESWLHATGSSRVASPGTGRSGEPRTSERAELERGSAPTMPSPAGLSGVRNRCVRFRLDERSGGPAPWQPLTKMAQDLQRAPVRSQARSQPVLRDRQRRPTIPPRPAAPSPTRCREPGRRPVAARCRPRPPSAPTRPRAARSRPRFVEPEPR